MAPTRASVDTSDEKGKPRQDTILDFEDRSHQVLLTGFGLFKGHESSNPSWEAVKQLQGTTLSSFGSIPATVQCINLPVVYSATLDTVPRLHGNLPSSPYAKPGFDERGPRDGSQGDGRSLPEGYDGLALPARGWAAVIHVGVGASGAFKLETLGHKRGYRSRDAFSKLPPSMSAPSRLRRFFGWCLCCRVFAPLYLLGRTVGLVLPSKWRSALWARIQSLFSGVDQHAERGFGPGYEECPDEAFTTLDVNALVSHLQARGHGPVAASSNAGHFLCDFTYYCSLVEAHKRTSDQQAATPVLFVHVPPDNQPHNNAACVAMLKDLIAATLAQRQQSLASG